MSFEILDTRLGAKLESLKQNFPKYLSSPYVSQGTETLNSNTLTQILSCGLLCDISGSSASITFPSSTEIQEVLNFQVGNYVNFNICAFSTTFPNPNTLSIVGNTDVTVVTPAVSTLGAQEIYPATLLCVSSNPIKYYII